MGLHRSIWFVSKGHWPLHEFILSYKPSKLSLFWVLFLNLINLHLLINMTVVWIGWLLFNLSFFLWYLPHLVAAARVNWVVFIAVGLHRFLITIWHYSLLQSEWRIPLELRLFVEGNLFPFSHVLDDWSSRLLLVFIDQKRKWRVVFLLDQGLRIRFSVVRRFEGFFSPLVGFYVLFAFIFRGVVVIHLVLIDLQVILVEMFLINCRFRRMLVWFVSILFIKWFIIRVWHLRIAVRLIIFSLSLSHLSVMLPLNDTTSHLLLYLILYKLEITASILRSWLRAKQ